MKRRAFEVLKENPERAKWLVMYRVEKRFHFRSALLNRRIKYEKPTRGAIIVDDFYDADIIVGLVEKYGGKAKIYFIVELNKDDIKKITRPFLETEKATSSPGKNY
ncbi:MAG: hypothetical protein ACP5IT_10640 [Thermoproteota archaeon]|jgi:hypothetical protein